MHALFRSLLFPQRDCSINGFILCTPFIDFATMKKSEEEEGKGEEEAGR